MNYKAICEEFYKYVMSMEDKERHTKEACEEAEQFDKLCMDKLPDDGESQVMLFTKMMDTAVEYEKSGFIAGFRIAFGLAWDLWKAGVENE